MNETEYAFLRHAAGDGPKVPADAPRRRNLLIELGRAGLLEMVRTDNAALPVVVVEETITFQGRCVYEAERDRRKAASPSHKAATAAWEIFRTAGALFLGMVIGHSEGCVFGEQQESGRRAEKDADREECRCCRHDPTAGGLELAPQVDAGLRLLPEVGADRADPDAEVVGEVGRREITLPDMDGEERGKGGASPVE